MTTEEQEKMIKDYLDAVLEAFKAKALEHYNESGLQTVERFKRATNIKNALKTVGPSNILGIAAGDYNHCPSGVCNGGVCTRELPFGDAELRKLGQDLGLPADFFSNA